MKIDLNAIVAMVRLDPIVLIWNGVGYTLRELETGETLRLDDLANMSDGEAVDFVSSLFSGEAPPFLADLKTTIQPSMKRALLVENFSLLSNTIVSAVAEQSRKKTLAALTMMQTQIQSPTSTPPSPESDASPS